MSSLIFTRRAPANGPQLVLITGGLLLAAVITLAWQGWSWSRSINALHADASQQERRNVVAEQDLQAFEAAAEAIALTHTRLLDSCAEAGPSGPIASAVPGAPARPAPAPEVPVQVALLRQAGIAVAVVPATAEDRARPVRIAGEMEFHRLAPVLAAAETSQPLLTTDEFSIEAPRGAALFSPTPMRLRLSAVLRVPLRASTPAPAPRR